MDFINEKLEVLLLEDEKTVLWRESMRQNGLQREKLDEKRNKRTSERGRKII